MPKDSSTKYYQDNKERLPKRLVKRCQSLHRRRKKRQYGREQYKNYPEDEKSRKNTSL